MSTESALNHPVPAQKERRPPPKRAVYIIPVFVFGIIAIAFAVGLTLNPREIPSVLIGKAVPEFSLPPVEGRTLGLSSSDFKGEVSLVNVFASWCTECRAEHPVLMELSKRNLLPIHGLNYKDKPVDAKNWLDGLGDPYTRTGADRDGRVAINWGVYGVPETFLVNQEGKIVFKHIGAITWKIFEEQIQPIITDLRKKTSL